MEELLNKEIKLFPKWVKHKNFEHLIIVLIFASLYIQYYFYSNQLIIETKDKFVNAYWATNKFLMIFGIYILPTPYIKRPFRFVWKLIQSASFVYLINILFLSFLDKNTIWIILNQLDSKLPDSKDEKFYATDCRIYTPENKISSFYNIYDSTFDVFFLSHFVGWFVKGFIFRNNILVWFCSIGFEFLELTFRYYLKNFYECWWDSFILDIFGMNLLGIVLANYVIKKFKMKKYHWFREPLIENAKNKSIIERVKYFLSSPREYNNIGKFHVLGNLKNYIFLIYIITFQYLIDLSNFFNKFIFRLPSSHFLLGYRIFTLGFSAIILYSDFYVYSHGTNPNKKISVSIYIANMILLVELFLFFKNASWDDFDSSIPIELKLIWGIIFSVIIFFGVIAYKNGKNIKIK